MACYSCGQPQCRYCAGWAFVALVLGIIAAAVTCQGCGSAIQTHARAATIAAVATQGAARVVEDAALEDARETCPERTASCLEPVRARWAPAEAAIGSTKAALTAWVEALDIARLAGEGADLWQPLAVAAARLVREYDRLVVVLRAAGIDAPPLPPFVSEVSELLGGAP